MELFLLQAGFEVLEEGEHKDEIRRFKHDSFHLKSFLLSPLLYFALNMAADVLILLLQAIVAKVQCGVEVSFHQFENFHFSRPFIIYVDIVVV